MIPTIMMRWVGAAALLASPCLAVDHYVRDGGTCTSGCNSWTNAADQITTALANVARGDTIWVADGAYSSITLNKAASGTSLIAIKKATLANHGTGTGWSAAYGAGQASISDIIMISDYWLVDGQQRNEGNWADVPSYGFRITGSVYAHTINNGIGSNNVTFQYVDVGGPASSSYSSAAPDHGFYLGGFGQILRNWTISRSHVHNVDLPFQLAGASNITIEYSRLGPSWSKETIRGQIYAANLTIRYNVMKDACQGTPGDATAGGCTAEIGVWDGTGGGNFDGSRIYGNVVWVTNATHHSDGCMYIGSNVTGVPANNTLIYNNTFIGIQSGSCNLNLLGNNSGNVAQNNLWYGLAAGVGSGCFVNSCSSNSVAASASQFINAAAGDFRLSGATAAGTTLPSPFNQDMTGAIRGGDGIWDRGAYEFASGGVPAPAPPVFLSLVAQ